MYNNILHYLRTGKLPKDLEKNQKDSLRRKSKNYLEKSGLLYFHDGKKLTCRLVFAAIMELAVSSLVK